MLKNPVKADPTKFWSYFLGISLGIAVAVIALVIGLVYGLKKKSRFFIVYGSPTASSSSSSSSRSSSHHHHSSHAWSSSSILPVTITKLIGGPNVGTPQQGTAVAISNDGLTLAIGAPYQSVSVGCIYIFVYNNGTWTQQSQIVGTGISGNSEMGINCSLSSNGNALIFGSPYTNSNSGVAFIWLRTGTSWSQQQLISGSANYYLGISVAMAGNGLVAVVGIPGYSTTGGFYVYTYSAGSWSQTGPLYGASGNSTQGLSVAISTDGSTIASGDFQTSNTIYIFKYMSNTWTSITSLTVSGGTFLANYNSLSLDNSGLNLVASVTYNGNAGYVVLFQNTSGTWSQKALLLPSQLTSASVHSDVALSQDASTLVIGNSGYNGSQGGIWIFVASGGTYVQAVELVGTANIGAAQQGYSVAVSFNGTTVVEGGLADNGQIGASWVFNGV